MDYIRRAELEMAALDPRLEAVDQEITAVGIVGTDVYDKVVILQAVKHIFPTSVIFTTDLDAIYCDPDRFDRYRNLLVASTYGLSLDEALQGPIPPFRESLQTSTFFATLKAVEFEFTNVNSPDESTASALPSKGEAAAKVGVKYEPAFQPRMFEIGRSGPFDLTGGAAPAWRTESREAGATSSRARQEPPYIHLVRSAVFWIWELVYGFFVPPPQVSAASEGTIRDINPPSRRGSVVVKWIQEHWVKVSLAVTLAGLGVLLAIATLRSGENSKTIARTKTHPWFVLFGSVVLITGLSFAGAYEVAWRVLPALVQNPAHEPMEFVEGISVWPSVLLKALLIVIAIACSLWTLRVGERIPESPGSPVQVFRFWSFALGPILAVKDALGAFARGIANCVRQLDRVGFVATAVDIRARVKQTFHVTSPPMSSDLTVPSALRTVKAQLDARSLGYRTLALATVVLLVALVLGVQAGSNLHESPARGWIRVLDEILTYASWFSLIVVVLLSALVVSTVQSFVKQQLDEYRKKFADLRDETSLDKSSLSRLEFCQQLRDLTAVALHCLYAPSILILLMFLCYNPLFDAWHWSLWLPLPFVVLSVVLVASAWLLGHRAMEIRRVLVEGLRDSAERAAKETRELVQERVERIIALDGGAFTRFVDMPLVRAVMIPISGLGGLSALQHLTPLLHPK